MRCPNDEPPQTGQAARGNDLALYPVRQTEPVNVEFTPVTTKVLRLDLDLNDGLSAGLYEWQVNAN